MPFSIFLSLLLVVLIVDVVWFFPQRTPRQLKYLVPMHQSLRNFLVAKKMIAGVVDLPVTRWSGPIKCGEMGNGIWYAEGQVGVQTSSDREEIVLWKAIYLPTSSEALYLAVGTQEKGDFDLALRRAGLKPPTP